ncbi:MAG: hypothetical protein COB66_09570 [Coxiella sp. (in: Bacteria)]|nr:MAG: hypothetical protein COB66_09570 [Coxiella sp. (in: g-proteobacteria)]
MKKIVIGLIGASVLAATAASAATHITYTNGNTDSPCITSSYGLTGLCVQWIGDSSGSVKYGTPAIAYAQAQYTNELIKTTMNMGRDLPAWPTRGAAIFINESSDSIGFSSHVDMTGATPNLCAFHLGTKDLLKAEKDNRVIRFVISKHNNAYVCNQQ